MCVESSSRKDCSRGGSPWRLRGKTLVASVEGVAMECLSVCRVTQILVATVTAFFFASIAELLK